MAEDEREQEKEVPGVQEIIEKKFGLDDLPFFRTPDYMYKLNYWLGATTAAAFFFAVLTGLPLLLYYDPSNAYAQTQFVIHNVPYGSVILFSHLYASYAMIVLLYVHGVRNFFSGAYKKPREFVWVLGVLLFAVTLGASFFGYSMVGDVLGVDAIGVGSGLISLGIPGGDTIESWLFGAGSGTSLFSRLLGWHIIFVALLGLLFGIHLFLAETYGMLPSRKEKPYAPAYYKKSEWMKFNAWWPRNFIYMMSIILTTWGVIMIVPNTLAALNQLMAVKLPLLINPAPAPAPNTAAAASVPAYPPWFFLFFYKVVDFLLPNGQPLTQGDDILILVVGIVLLLLVPFLDRSKYLSPLQRKFWTWIGIVFVSAIIELTVWGYLDPGVPAPFTQVVEVFGPTALVAALVVAPLKPRGTSPMRGMTSQLSSLYMMVLILLTAGTFFDFVKSPSLVGLGILIPLIAGLILNSWSMLPDRRMPPTKALETSVRRSPSSSLSFKKKLATYATIIMAVASVAILVLVWNLPTTGPLSNVAGALIGVVLVLWGQSVGMYHFVAYAK
jgi:Cytochrome b subunit of the bc complex